MLVPCLLYENFTSFGWIDGWMCLRSDPGLYGGMCASSIIEDTAFDRVEQVEKAYTKEENFIMRHGRKFRNGENSTNWKTMRGLSPYD